MLLNHKLLSLFLLFIVITASGCAQNADQTATPAQTMIRATAAPPPAPAPTPTPAPVEASYKDPGLPINQRVDDLLSRMSLAEKIGQMTLIEKNSVSNDLITGAFLGGVLSGGSGYPYPNTPQAWVDMVNGFQQAALDTPLAIPLIYGVDAVHGHNNVYGATIFPQNVGLGAANNPALMEQIGRVTAREMAATGIYWNYAPVVAVPQDIRWGRTYEGYSQNTAIVQALAPAFLRGMQSDTLTPPNIVIGTPKHFVGDGGTVWGSSTTDNYMIDQGDTQVNEATLRAVHLPPYTAAIGAGARSIMISFSSWNGTKMHAQDYLINDVLKGELGFDGFVVSDWGGIDQISPDYYKAVVAAINAGVDMNMVPYRANLFIDTMTEAVEAGDIPMERIDDAVRRILTVKFEMGLFEQPFANESLLPTIGSDEHRAVARQAVAESLVLLKNENNVLPLAKDTPLIYVAGEAANDIGMQSGGWTIDWQGGRGDITPGTTILEAVEATVSGQTTVVYDEFGDFDGGVTADVCLAVIGEEPYAEGLGDDGSLSLRANDLDMLSRLPEQCNAIVVVIISGRPLMVADLLPEWDALVAAWLPGSEGQGVADVLFGDQLFTGKLPLAWPQSIEQLDSPGGAEPLYPVGFGLD